MPPWPAHLPPGGQRLRRLEDGGKVQRRRYGTNDGATGLPRTCRPGLVDGTGAGSVGGGSRRRGARRYLRRIRRIGLGSPIGVMVVVAAAAAVLPATTQPTPQLQQLLAGRWHSLLTGGGTGYRARVILVVALLPLCSPQCEPRQRSECKRPQYSRHEMCWSNQKDLADDGGRHSRYQQPMIREVLSNAARFVRRSIGKAMQ